MGQETVIIQHIATSSQAVALANYGQFPVAEFLQLENTLLETSAESNSAVQYSKDALQQFLLADYAAALAIYNEAIEKFPKEPFFYACRWIINQQQEDEESAFYDYQIAKRLDFNYHSFLEWLENKDHIDDFVEDSPEIAELLEQLDITGPQVDTYHQLALAYVHAFDYLKAIAFYTASIALDEQASTYVFRGAIYAKLIQYPLALSDYDRAVALDPSCKQAYVFRAKLLESLGSFEEAFADYKRALDLDPTMAVIFEERAALYERLEKFEEAMTDYNTWIDLMKEDFYPLTLRADLKERVEDWEGALADYSAAIALNPYYSDLYQYRAEIKTRLGDVVGAEADYEKFEEIENEDN